MKIAVLLLFMANILSAGDVPVPDWANIEFPSELRQGPVENWRDGNSVKYGLTSGMRLQQVYSSESFAKIASQGGWIDGFVLQADRVWKGSIQRDLKGIQIFMGYTFLDPKALNSDFASNRTGEMMEMRSNDDITPLEIASDGRQPLGPAVVLGFNGRGFFYDPSRGNLVIDIIPTAGFGIPLDYQTDGKGEFGSVFADFGFKGYPDSGEVSAGGFVTSLRINRIPEPSVVGLAALGGAALLAASRQRKSNP